MYKRQILIEIPGIGPKKMNELLKKFKDIDEIIDSVDKAGISSPVARMVPLGVVKG